MSITIVRFPLALVNPLNETWVHTKGVRVLAIVLAAVAVSLAGRLWIRRFRRRLEGTPDLTQAIDLKRTTTIVTTVTNAVRVVVWGTAPNVRPRRARDHGARSEPRSGFSLSRARRV